MSPDDTQMSSPPAPPPAVIDALPESFVEIGCLIDANGRIVQVLSKPSHSSAILRSRSGEESGPQIAFVREVRQRLDEILSETQGPEQAQTFEVSVETSSGARRWYELCVAPLQTGDGERRALTMARDVSDERTEQMKLASRAEEVWSAINASEDLFFVYDSTGTLVRWNDTVNRALGYSDDELAGADATAFVAEEEKDRIAQQFAAALEAGSVRLVATLVTKDGTRIPHQFVASRAETASGETIVSGIGRDISDQIERENQLAVLSRVLRHNVRNKMTVVAGRAEYLADRVPESEIAALERIEEAATELQSVSENALDITRLLIDDPPVEPVDLDADLQSICAQLRESYPEVTLTLDVDPDVTILGVPEIGRAFHELVENACQHNDAPEVTVTAERTGRRVVLRVEDDGTGLPPNEENVITQSQPTTALFHGVGIGLWLVRWLVRLSDGSVSYRESEAGGACFEVRLDRVD